MNKVDVMISAEKVLSDDYVQYNIDKGAHANIYTILEGEGVKFCSRPTVHEFITDINNSSLSRDARIFTLEAVAADLSVIADSLDLLRK